MHSLSLQMARALSTPQQIDGELNKWLAMCVTNKVPPDDIVSAMLQTGRNPDLCTMLVKLAYDGLFVNNIGDERLVRRSVSATPDAPHAIQHYADGGDMQPRILMTMDSLKVTLFEEFLTDEECEHFKELVKDRLQRSKVVGQNFQNKDYDGRTSSGAFIDIAATETIDKIEKRIEKITGVPVNHGECFQVLHYRNTEEYQPHFDFLNHKMIMKKCCYQNQAIECIL
jgi:hypothetical protein